MLGLLWIIGLQNIYRNQKKQRKIVGIVIWLELRKNTGKVPRFYAKECKNEARVDVGIPIGLGCRNAIHRNFRGVNPLIQMDSLGKILRIRFLQNSSKKSSIQRDPKRGIVP